MTRIISYFLIMLSFYPSTVQAWDWPWPWANDLKFSQKQADEDFNHFKEEQEKIFQTHFNSFEKERREYIKDYCEKKVPKENNVDIYEKKFREYTEDFFQNLREAIVENNEQIWKPPLILQLCRALCVLLWAQKKEKEAVALYIGSAYRCDKEKIWDSWNKMSKASIIECDNPTIEEKISVRKGPWIRDRMNYYRAQVSDKEAISSEIFIKELIRLNPGLKPLEDRIFGESSFFNQAPHPKEEVLNFLDEILKTFNQTHEH